MRGTESRSTAAPDNQRDLLLAVFTGVGAAVAELPAALKREAAERKLHGPIAGLLFDTCGVLYDETMWDVWLFRLAARMGMRTGYRAFLETWRRDYLPRVHCGRRNYWQALRTFLAWAGLAAGQIDEAVAAARARYRQFVENVRPLPGVSATLLRLSAAGVRLGVVSTSSCSSPRLAQRLERLRLRVRFRAVVSSVDIGCTPPNVACFCAALSEMGLSPGQTAFVGHDAAELAGATRAGMKTIAVNHSHDARADVYLQRLEELPLVIENCACPSVSGGKHD